MTKCSYAHVCRLSGKLLTRLAALAVGLLLAPAAWAQIEVPAGNPLAGTGRGPLGTHFGFERSALIYTAAEIATRGNLTHIGFYLNAVSAPGAASIKVYLKTVSNVSFTANTTVVAEKTGATLVYDATIPAAAFTANTWVTMPLTAPFAYDGTSNLEVIVETNARGAGNELASAKAFRYGSTGASSSAGESSKRAQFWTNNNTPPSGVGTLSLLRPNIQLTGLAPWNCLPATDLIVSNVTSTSAQVSFMSRIVPSDYTVTYTPVDGATTTITPTTSPVSLTGLADATTYTVTIVRNCSGSGVSALVTTTFTTLPANDECATATAVSAGNCMMVSNSGATASMGVPAPKPTAAGGCFPAGILVTNDVWCSIVVPNSGGLTVTTNPTFGSDVTDTGMTLYTGNCGALTEVACNDNEDEGPSGFRTFSSIRAIGLTPGSTVYARIWSYGGTTPTGRFIVCVEPVPVNDAAMRIIYALGKVPLGVSQVVKAVVTNTSVSTITDLPVTLEITGATTLRDIQTVATLAPGASTTISFGAYTSNAIGTNTLKVTVPADEVMTNNLQTYTQLVTGNTFSYANNSGSGPGIGFDPSVTGAFVVRYNIPVARSLNGITVALTGENTERQTVYGVVVNSSGVVLARTPDYRIVADDANRRKTFALAVPLALAAGDFYVGLVQTAFGGADSKPLVMLPEDPTRPGTYFTIAPFTPTAGGTLTDAAPNNWGGFVVEAETDRVLSTSAALTRAISLYPNPSNGRVTLDIRQAKAKGAIQVQVTNLLGQVVHTATVRDNAENQLDLTGLAAGAYTLRVSSGAEYTMRQLVLTK